MAYFTKVHGFIRDSFFAPHHQTKAHCVQLVLAVAIISLTAARISTKPSRIPVSRADFLGIVMAVKTLVILTYQTLTSRIDRLRRWRSLKAYLIINIMEVIFWFAVVVVTLMGITKFCQATHCALGWVLALFALTLVFLSIWLSISMSNLRREEASYGAHSQRKLDDRDHGLKLSSNFTHQQV